MKNNYSRHKKKKRPEFCHVSRPQRNTVLTNAHKPRFSKEIQEVIRLWITLCTNVRNLQKQP